MGVGVSSLASNGRVRVNGNQELSALGPRSGARNGGSCGPPSLLALLALVFVNIVTPKYKSEATRL